MIDNAYKECVEELNQRLIQHQRDLRRAVVQRALQLFNGTEFKTAIDLPQRITAYNKRITTAFNTAEFSINVETDRLNITLADSELWKQLRYGTLWFAPVLQLQEDLSNTVFNYISGIY